MVGEGAHVRERPPEALSALTVSWAGYFAGVTNVGRNALALLASLSVGILAAQGIGSAELALIASNGASSGIIVAGVLANLFIVPAAAGVVLGLIARGSLLQLSIVSLVLSLLATFVFLGAAGLPDWSKVFTYVFQWVVLYQAARFGARHAPRPTVAR